MENDHPRDEVGKIIFNLLYFINQKQLRGYELSKKKKFKAKKTIFKLQTKLIMMMKFI